MSDLVRRCIAAVDAVEVRTETDDWVHHFVGTELPNEVQAAIARALISLVLDEAVIAVRFERLDDPQPGTSDEAYEIAISDALAAIRAIQEQCK